LPSLIFQNILVEHICVMCFFLVILCNIVGLPFINHSSFIGENDVLRVFLWYGWFYFTWMSKTPSLPISFMDLHHYWHKSFSKGWLVKNMRTLQMWLWQCPPHSHIIKINKMKSKSNTPTNLAIAIMQVVDYVVFLLLKIVSCV
jgi:hypothetical protein